MLSNLSSTSIKYWVAAFLSGRTQSAHVNSSRSNRSCDSSRVIQGSVLGPLLFTLYINDLLSVCVDCVVKLYTDDVKVFKRIFNSADSILFQSAKNAICAWTRQLGLNLSIDNCKYLQLGYQKLTLVYTLNPQLVSSCSSV